MMNNAPSVDGKLAPVPSRRTPTFRPSRLPEDHWRMHELRGRADAIVIGAGNLRTDNPDLALLPEEHARRRSLALKEPLRVVITRSGERIDTAARMFDRARGGEPVVAHAVTMSAETRARIAPFATLVEMGDQAVDIPRLLAWLATERDVRTALVEGGGEVNAAFFAASAVDEVYVTIVPRILGGRDAPTMVDGPGFAEDAIPELTLASVEHIGNELFLRYDVTWPGSRR